MSNNRDTRSFLTLLQDYLSFPRPSLLGVLKGSVATVPVITGLIGTLFVGRVFQLGSA
jgi:hypothetical protein